MTIGKKLSHIENAKLDDVKNFFFKHYRPNNAILVVAGNVTVEKVKELAEKWFADIAAGEKYVRKLPQEPPQTEARKLEVKAEVPLDAFYKCWHIYPRNDKRYYIADLITEVLSGGGSSRLFQALVKEKKMFSAVECYHSGSLDAGTLVIEGKLVKGIKMEDAEKAVEAELEKMRTEKVTTTELQKVKNKVESLIAFEDMSLTNRANSLAFYELLGDAEQMNHELEKYNVVTAEDILNESQVIFRAANSNTLYYFAKQN
jgi:predicted Zn-dependent peptidase